MMIQITVKCFLIDTEFNVRKNVASNPTNSRTDLCELLLL